MVYLLSYAHVAIASSGNMQVHSKVESSVRKLFTELAKSQRGSMKSVATVQKQLPQSYVPAPRSFRKNVEIKKGGWTCARCSLMNIVNNKQSLQCDEHWPKKFLIGGEWECPQCNFCNFSKNVVCLRCDCKKPGVNQFLGPTSDLNSRADKSSVEDNTKKIKAGIEHEQQWFTKIAELENSSDMSSALAYENLNETMETGDSSFAASTRNSGIDRDQINRRTYGDENSINVNVNQSLDKLGQKTYPYQSNKGDVGKSKASSFPGMSSASQFEQHNEPKAVLDTDAPVHQQMFSEKSSSQLENKDYERDQAEKSERWSTKVEELHEVKGLPNAVSDDNFPEIMLMRKGENQFVVSKKKDRSLTSPIKKRRVAMEQERKNNYVPFVPFPPGYFAKDNSQESSESTHSDEQIGAMSLESGGVGERKEGESSSTVLEASNYTNENPITFDSQYNSHDDHSKSPGTSENAHVKASWGESSLEGSAVKEPNPLDMSEEAKAERWFRRVAQIKDISELSQIPDEDFPSIMPMRKGVNRFVVSKRKTPLERRLTSPHYRRNLPVSGSGPIKKEMDSD